MANARMLTLVRNLVETRRLPYIPPNGRVMQNGETAIISGALETQIYLGMLKTIQDEYIYDLLNDRIAVSTEGFGGSGSDIYYNALLGNGLSTVFVVDVGFSTAGARIFMFDELGGGPIYFFTAETETPGPTQITITLSPAPATNQISLFVFPP